MSRDGHIDVLRGVAILLILILHAGALTPGLEERRYLEILIGRMSSGMQLFFVLSGYLIARSWEGTRGSPNSFRIFAIKRIGKIVPLYVIFLNLNIITFLWIDAFDPSYIPLRNSVSHENLTVVNYIVHLFFLQGFTPGWLHTLVDGSWSVVAEVYFYILFPVFLDPRSRTIRLAFKVYVWTLGLAIVAVELIGGRLPGSYGYYNFATQLPCFVLGVLAFRVIHDPLLYKILAKWSPTLLFLAFVLGVGMINGSISPVGTHNLYGMVFAIMLVALSCLSTKNIYVARLNLLRILGQQSYALYFSHLILLKAQHYILVERMGVNDFWIFFILNLFTSVIVSLAVSAVLLHPIDQYFVKRASMAAAKLAMKGRGERLGDYYH